MKIFITLYMNARVESACPYRLMEDLEHGGGGLLGLNDEGFFGGLVVHGVIVVDHLLRHLKRENIGHRMT